MSRPQLYPGGRQVSTLVSAEDYRILRELVEEARLKHPYYTMGDLVRGYIQRCLKQDHRIEQPSPDPRQSPVRQLHAIARHARSLALELERNGNGK